MLTVRRYLIPTMGVWIEELPLAKHKIRPPLREALNNADSLRPLDGAVTGITAHRVEGDRMQAPALLDRP